LNEVPTVASSVPALFVGHDCGDPRGIQQTSNCYCYYAPPRGIKRWCCLTSVCLSSISYIWSTGGVCGRPAGWRVLADWARLGRPGSRRFRCRPGRGHIVAAAHLQLVVHVIALFSRFGFYR